MRMLPMRETGPVAERTYLGLNLDEMRITWAALRVHDENDLADAIEAALFLAGMSFCRCDQAHVLPVEVCHSGAGRW